MKGFLVNEKAIRRARKDVISLVSGASTNFVDHAVDHLDKYIAKIQGNIETYQKSVWKVPQEEKGR